MSICFINRLKAVIVLISIIIALSLSSDKHTTSLTAENSQEEFEEELQIIQSAAVINVVLEESLKETKVPIEGNEPKILTPVSHTDNNEIVKVVRSNKYVPIVSRAGDSIAIKRQELLGDKAKLVVITAQDKTQPAGVKTFAAEAPVQPSERMSQKTLVVQATAYCPGTPGSGCPVNRQGHSQCTGPYNDGITATGRPAKAGDGSKANPHIIAVDPRVIPLGSLVYIDGYGYALAADTGSKIKGNRIDILFDTHEKACEFGRQTLEIQILNEGVVQ